MQNLLTSYFQRLTHVFAAFAELRTRPPSPKMSELDSTIHSGRMYGRCHLAPLHL